MGLHYSQLILMELSDFASIILYRDICELLYLFNSIGLPWSANDEVLREAFASFGEVTEGSSNYTLWLDDITMRMLHLGSVLAEASQT